MGSGGDIGFFIWILSILHLLCFSFGYKPIDNYLVDCGSPNKYNTSVDDRVFVYDGFYSNSLETPNDILVNALSISNLSTFNSTLYRTARVFNETSQYNFPIKKHGWHWIRLHFSPFVNQSYNMSYAKFSVYADGFTLFKHHQIDPGVHIKEYSLNISSNTLVLTFTPSPKSLAFVNALEVFSLPDELLSTRAKIVSAQESYESLWNQALETVLRVNMGNETVFPQNDTLWRLWVSDNSFLIHNNLGKPESNKSVVDFSRGNSTKEIAPKSVYGTATKLNSDGDPMTTANVTWNFDVDPGFDYLVRFHFCDIGNSNSSNRLFNVYMNSLHVSRNLDFGNQGTNDTGAPYYMDVILKSNCYAKLNVSVGPYNVQDVYPVAFLNGLEVMKISNSKGSLDPLDSSFKSSSNSKTVLIVGLAVGLFVVVLLAIVIVLLCRRRKQALVEHLKEENKYNNRTGISFASKSGYRFPLLLIQEATDNFSESLVVGVGGVGKVYKGVLKDNTKVAVKRGVVQSNQGLSEFWTEIEMLSQFRHRHLVSLIGYCDEQNETIIVYEYMENGTLKSHLYGSDLPRLSWKQRLEICIGSARGLHYLHTGSTKAIIHRDVKSANILLDENFMAKVADFGLSKTGPEIDQTHVSTAVKGSFGYLDPEYLTRQQLTDKSDVYSFGVVLLEVLCGRPVIDPSLPWEKVNLIEWAMKLHKRGQLEEIVDPCLAGQIKPESLRKFVEIIQKCMAESGVLRPTMGDVFWNLECALQLQEADERAHSTYELSSSVNQISQTEIGTSESTALFNAMSLGDLNDVSMSKVFAQMVKEEMLYCT